MAIKTRAYHQQRLFGGQPVSEKVTRLLLEKKHEYEYVGDPCPECLTEVLPLPRTRMGVLMALLKDWTNTTYQLYWIRRDIRALQQSRRATRRTL